MVIFINDRPVLFIESKQSFSSPKNGFDTIVSDTVQFKSIKDWRKKVLIPNGNNTMITGFFAAIKEIKYFDFKNLTIIVSDLEEALETVFAQYKVMDAAGGVILNKEKKLLMIYRLDKWDLPKGKAEKGETIKETAEREVEEECNIKVKVLKDYFVSYHTFLFKNQRVLKRTYWYKMKLISDENMAPQKSENIEEILWMNRKEMNKALSKSYASIAHVLDNLLNQDLKFSKG